jgi:hypothetical protein
MSKTSKKPCLVTKEGLKLNVYLNAFREKSDGNNNLFDVFEKAMVRINIPIEDFDELDIEDITAILNETTKGANDNNIYYISQMSNNFQ